MSAKILLKNNFLPLVLLAVGTVIAAVFLAFPKYCGIADCYQYFGLAKSIIQYKSFSLAGIPNNFRPPIYPLFIAFVNLFVKNIYFSAKIISFISGALTIPLVYYLWKILENKTVAIFAAILFMLHPLALVYRLFPMTETLFTFFVVASFLFLYLSRKNQKYLIFAGITAMLAALTRWEGLFLIIALFVSVFIWSKAGVWSNLKNLLSNKLLIATTALTIIPIVIWLTRNYVLTGKIISESYSESVSFTVVSWLYNASMTLTVPLVILFIIGIYFSFENKSQYLPIYSFLLLYLGLHTAFGYSTGRYLIVTIPLLFGFAAKSIFDVHSYCANKLSFGRKVRTATLIIILLFTCFSFYPQISVAQQEISSANKFEVYEKFAEWAKTNVDANSTWVVMDAPTYDYYLDNVYGINFFYDKINATNKTADEITSFLLYEFMKAHVNYVVVYDTAEGSINIGGTPLFSNKLWYEEKVPEVRGKSVIKQVDAVLTVDLFSYTGEHLLFSVKLESKFLDFGITEAGSEVVSLYRLNWLARGAVG